MIHSETCHPDKAGQQSIPCLVIHKSCGMRTEKRNESSLFCPEYQANTIKSGYKWVPSFFRDQRVAGSNPVASTNGAVSKRLERVKLRQPFRYGDETEPGNEKGRNTEKHIQTGDKSLVLLLLFVSSPVLSSRHCPTRASPLRVAACKPGRSPRGLDIPLSRRYNGLGMEQTGV